MHACQYYNAVMPFVKVMVEQFYAKRSTLPHGLSTVAILYNAPEYQDEFGQTTTYSFNPGYNLVGDGTRICQATGL